MPYEPPKKISWETLQAHGIDDSVCRNFNTYSQGRDDEVSEDMIAFLCSEPAVKIDLVARMLMVNLEYQAFDATCDNSMARYERLCKAQGADPGDDDVVREVLGRMLLEHWWEKKQLTEVALPLV